jgi:thiamine biosynthesis lipoprotein
MKNTKLIMGMPITIEVLDDVVTERDLEAVYDYFTYIDEEFSTYKPVKFL